MVYLSKRGAKKLSKGYATKLTNEIIYGEALLTKTNIYVKLLQDLQVNKNRHPLYCQYHGAWFKENNASHR